MVRNAGKFGKPKRGGGKHFTNARELRAQDNENGGENKDSDEDSDEEEDEDEESSDDSDGFGGKIGSGPSTSTSASMAGPSMAGSGAEKLKPGEVDKFGNVVQEPEMTKREAKRAAKAKEEAAAAAAAAKQSQKQQQKPNQKQGVKFESSDGDSSSSEDEDGDPILNAGNANKGLNKQMKMSSLGESAKKPAAAASRAPEPMNRKEREELAKKQARERYLEMHRAGKTDEAKADLARLAKIRKDREEAAARKLAEKASAEEAKQKTMVANGRVKK